MKTTKGKIVLAAIMTATLTAGCGSAGAGKTEGTGSEQKTAEIDLTKPVTLKIFDANSTPETLFTKQIADPIKAKFPNVSFEVIHPGKGSYITELAATGNLADLYLTTTWDFPKLIATKLVLELTEPIRKSKVDMNGYQPTLVDTIQKFSPNGDQIYALPYKSYASVLNYNKDVFDKFGVSYPKDGMSYEEAIQLGKTMARTDGETQFIGFFPGNYSFLYSYFNKGFIDLNNKKATVNNPEMERVFKLLQDGFNVPGVSYFDYTQAHKLFYTNKTLAMYPFHYDLSRLEEAAKKGDKLEWWDMAQTPTIDGYSRSAAPSLVSVSAHTEHQALVFEIAKFLSTSLEYQTKLSREGTLPALKDKTVEQAFGSELGILKGKHIEAVFKQNPQKLAETSEYDRIPNPYLLEASKSVVTGSLDINSALRKAEEQSNVKLAEELR